MCSSGSSPDTGRMRPYTIGEPADVETAQKMYPCITPHPAKTTGGDHGPRGPPRPRVPPQHHGGVRACFLPPVLQCRGVGQRQSGSRRASLVPLSHVTQGSRVFSSGGMDMARGRKTSLRLHLTPAQRRTFLAWQRATTIPAGQARRARILLLVADGLPITAIAAAVGRSRRFVYKWVQRFREQGIEGLANQPRPGSQRVSRLAALADAPRKSA